MRASKYQIIFNKIALNTSRRAFIVTRQVCIAIMAIMPSLHVKYKTYPDFRRTARQNAYISTYAYYNIF